jgi:hypothetical protein
VTERSWLLVALAAILVAVALSAVLLLATRLVVTVLTGN